MCHYLCLLTYFCFVLSSASDASGRTVFVGDASNARIRAIDIATGLVSTLAGSGAITHADEYGTSAGFRSPRGLALDAEGNLIAADYDDNRVRRVSVGSMPCRAGRWCPAASAAPVACPIASFCGASRLDKPTTWCDVDVV